MGRQDWMLMHRIAAGDEEAISELFDRFGSLVYKVAWQFQPNHAEAEEAVQEIFVRLWRTADRYDPRRAKLVTWVMLIARRHLIDRLRRSAVRPTAVGFDGDLPDRPDRARPDDPPQTTESHAAIIKRMNDLPELQRTVIERAYLHGFTLREISEQLDAPLGTIKSALSRGLARLRQRGASDRAV